MNLAPLFTVEPKERLARLRSLRMAARLVCGRRGTELERALHAAERDEAALPAAVACLERLAGAAADHG